MLLVGGMRLYLGLVLWLCFCCFAVSIPKLVAFPQRLFLRESGWDGVGIHKRQKTNLDSESHTEHMLNFRSRIPPRYPSFLRRRRSVSDAAFEREMRGGAFKMQSLTEPKVATWRRRERLTNAAARAWILSPKICELFQIKIVGQKEEEGKVCL